MTGPQMENPCDPVVYVIDDDAGVRETLSGLLRTVGLKSQGFGSTDDFLAHPRPDAPSCIILDVRVPGVGGMELQRQLNDRLDPTPIIFMTGHADLPMSVRAMKAGAAEFFTKPFRDQDLLDAVQLAISRDRARHDERRRLAALQDRYEGLTAREREVLKMMLTGRLNKQIAADIGASESSVKVHRMHVMRKMGAASLVELIRMAGVLNLG